MQITFAKDRHESLIADKMHRVQTSASVDFKQIIEKAAVS
jgi:hypothetical protein